MNRAFLLIPALAMGLVYSAEANAAKPKISVDAAPGVDFTVYKTYAWVSTAVPSGMNPVMYQRMIGSFDQALAAKGYQKAEAGDLSVVMTIGAQDKTDVETWGRFGLQTSVYQYTVGQVSFDVFDTKTQKALWHGQASKTINPDKPDPAGVDAAISKLMQNFPATAAPAASPATGAAPSQ